MDELDSDHFDFIPERSFKESLLKRFPISFQVAFFNLILPICDYPECFFEALRMASSANTFAPILFDQLNQKYPDLVDANFTGNGASLPAGRRVKHQETLLISLLLTLIIYYLVIAKILLI